MRRRHIAAILALFTLMVLVPAFAQTALAAGPERPYRGSCSTVVTPVSQQELSIEGDCTLTHLGRTKAITTQIVTPTGQSGAIVTLLITNRTIYTSASGDKLNMHFIGTGHLDTQSGEVKFIGVETFEGGTGRFAHAAGNSEVQGNASIFTNLGFFTTEGRIAY